MTCSLCERVKKLKEGSYPFLIHEFEHSFLLLGEHQFYKGYCVLVSKAHHREMADIPSPEREELFQEMMISSKVIQTVFKPKKMNLSSLGNVVEHLHWHFFPRYAEDPQFLNPPWLQMHLFDPSLLNSEERDELLKILKNEFVALAQRRQ
jgi:diadenosine tetraphosphate (Ap4A) HIT family hydrolase